jgi:predicted Zn finger-like uncharacterized protein
MITTCTDCHARYRLDPERVPQRQVRVRCPSCRGVFVLDGTAREEETAEVVEAVTRVPSPVQAVVDAFEPAGLAPRAQAAAPTFAPAATLERPGTPAATAVMDQPVQTRRRRSKEEMLARALVSDIKVYNREVYEKALADGNLLEALGPEIKKSWELYKDKVTPEVAGSTEYFRDALNEILAGGTQVF